MQRRFHKTVVSKAILVVIRERVEKANLIIFIDKKNSSFVGVINKITNYLRCGRLILIY